MTMYLPPTPPDDRTLLSLKNPATPPAAANPLTPDSTPPGMRRGLRHASNDHSTLRPEASQPTDHQEEGSPSSSGIFPDPIKREGRTPEVPGAFKEAEWESYIPVSESQELSDAADKHDVHVTETLPVFSPSAREAATLLSARDFPVRQKPRRRMRNAKRQAHHPSLSPPQSDEWNDLPPDMISNNQRNARQVSNNKMAHIEGLGAATAVEVVILQPQDTHSKSLRHIKKCHSLRMRVSETPSTATNHERHPWEWRTENHSSPHGQTATMKSDGNTQHTLKHRKAFESIQHPPSLPRVLGVANSFDHARNTHTLRHERRPLSAGNRSQTSSHRDGQSQTRHVSLPMQLPELDRNQSDLLHAHSDTPEDKSTRATASTPKRKSSGGFNAALSPSVNSQRFANTPMSGMSDRTEMELCVAKDVIMFPHSNDSVMLIDNEKKHSTLTIPLAPRTFRPLSFTFEDPESASTSSTESFTRSFSTPEIQINGATHTVDSPLTNPRAAPAPPAINFIPPTPSSELDLQLPSQDTRLTSSKPVQRSGSLIKKARRISDSLITPFFPRATESYRLSTTRSPHVASLSNDRLHPMWVPTHMWDDDEYSDDEECYDDEDYDQLPAGGDTSDHPVERRSLFPRQMSVRMPGFRGNGGFLLGNSLGFERHGSNRRRHYVDIPVKDKRSSAGRFTLFKNLKNRVNNRRRASQDDAVVAAVTIKELPLRYETISLPQTGSNRL